MYNDQQVVCPGELGVWKVCFRLIRHGLSMINSLLVRLNEKYLVRWYGPRCRERGCGHGLRLYLGRQLHCVKVLCVDIRNLMVCGAYNLVSISSSSNAIYGLRCSICHEIEVLT